MSSGLVPLQQELLNYPINTRFDMAMSITPSETDTIRINIENLTDEDYYPYSHSTHQVTVGESANLRLSYSKSF